MKSFGKLLVAAAGVAVAVLAAPGTWASGTVSAPGAAPNPYQAGQAVYARKVACKTCAYPGGLKGMDSVQEALQKIESGALSLTAEERTAVTAYINRRFKGN